MCYDLSLSGKLDVATAKKYAMDALRLVRFGEAC